MEQDHRNVVDAYKGLSVEVIREKLAERQRPFAILMLNIERDPNVGAIVRTANHFNAREVFYYGRRKYNRQAALGTYLYTDVHFFEDPDALVHATQEYTWVGVEQKPDAVPLQKYAWPSQPLLVFGHERAGLDVSPEILYYCKELVAIPTLGSVRSLNVSCATGIAMYDLCLKKGWF